MKVFNYIILLSVTVLVMLVVSCNDLKSDDRTPPEISGIIFNMNDTLFLLDDQATTNAKAREQEKYIVLNDSATKDPLSADTIVFGEMLTFSARLTDEGDGLSAVLIHIWGDTLLQEVKKDTAFYKNKIVPTINMFGRNEYQVSKLLLQTVVPDSIKVDGKNVGFSQDDSYWYQVNVIDAAGNESFVKLDKKIRFLSREAAIEGYSEKNKR